MDELTSSFVKLQVSMEEEDDTDMYSSPCENYLRLINTIETLESNQRLTEDWFEEHKHHIFKYREVFPRFDTINEDFQDTAFRRKAIETEAILSDLVQEIQMTGVFTPEVYLLLNRRMKEMCDLIWSEEELLEMFGGMRM